MVRDPFTGARLKVERARHHLVELKLEEQRWFGRKRYGVVIEPEIETSGEEVWVERFRLTDPSQPIPLAFSLVVGDAIHNLRSALDHLACRLADLGTGCTGTTAFPIFDNRPEYVDKEAGLLAGISGADRVIIESLQPYHARAHLDAGSRFGMYDALAVNFGLMAIGRLDNRDKHRLLLPAIPLMPFTKSHDWEGVAKATVNHVQEDWVRMEEGAELLRLRDVEFLPGHTEVKVKGSPSFGVIFGDPELALTTIWTDRTKGAVSGVDLRHMADRIEEIIGRF